MDFQNLIEKHQVFKTYFIDFPKKLHQLASEGRDFLKFHKKGLWIDIMKLNDYLLSSESIFNIRCIIDFIETLHVLRFHRANQTKNETGFIFINPNFNQDQEVPDDFYKQTFEGVKNNVLNGTRRLSIIHNFGLFEKLLRMEKRSEAKMSRLEFARLRLKFALQKQLDLKRCEIDTIEHNIEEPDYVKNQDIAGYYGNVELSLLKNAFGNYFPIYQSDEATANIQQQLPPETLPIAIEEELVQKVEENNTDQKVPMEIDDPQINDMQPIIEIERIIPLNNITNSTSSVPKRKRSLRTTRVYSDENKENCPPRKRSLRSYDKKITMKETNNALLNLKKEIENFN
ncbi:hypothetical protein PVAND_013241 [Polypedilum vanderplanki]|uniref:Uncharacterized protein n=1 Tax=Polypedilum vanderplanki TaxID=319348 RepID=A0A9J6CQ32_POLVA|nr:hypothetical protein PVAND_013241 [Polypedilum vanderplanki]